MNPQVYLDSLARASRIHSEKHIYHPKPNATSVAGSGLIRTGMVKNTVRRGSIPKLIIPRLAPGINKIQSNTVKFLTFQK